MPAQPVEVPAKTWHRRGRPTDVNAVYMKWGKGSKEPDNEPRGYHHGNLKEALVRAALALIAEKGPAGFTFADAARWAGVSPAAPYRHYRDREALLADVARRGFELFAAALAKAWDEGRPDLMRAFDRLGKSYLDFAKTSRPITRRCSRPACRSMPTRNCGRRVSWPSPCCGRRRKSWCC